MTDLPTIAVIIPAFNADKTIRLAIESVISQTQQVDQIIVVNNNSTDDTSTVVEGFGERIISLNCEEQGVSNARNLGVAVASTEYIAFLDADDAWDSRKIEEQTVLLGKFRSGKTIFGCYANFIVGERKIGRSIESQNDEVALRNFIIEGHLPCITSSWLISREGYLELGGMDPNIHTAEDFEFVCRAVSRGYRFSIIRSPLVDYNISLGTISHINYLEQFFRAKYYRMKYFGNKSEISFDQFLDQIPFMGHDWRHARASMHIRLAMVQYSQNYRIRAFYSIGLALLLSFSSTLRKAIRQFRWV